MKEQTGEPDAAKEKSEALKGGASKGGKHSKGSTGMMALADIEPPVDPNSMVPQTEAKTRCKQDAQKLGAKGYDLDNVVVGIGKKGSAFSKILCSFIL